MLNNHALILAGGDVRKAINISFRGGPCNICGGGCMCNENTHVLIQRVKSGEKPVAIFVGTRVLKYLKDVYTKVIRNKWGCIITIATRYNNLRKEAFSEAFYNEQMDFNRVSELYGYPTLDEVHENCEHYFAQLNPLENEQSMKEYDWYVRGVSSTEELFENELSENE